MNRYSDTNQCQDKVAQRFNPETNIKGYMDRMGEIRDQEEVVDGFLKTFRENYFGEDETKENIFFQALMSQHRTHQQSIMKNMFKKYANESLDNDWFDARNEQGLKWAKEATDLEAYFPCI